MKIVLVSRSDKTGGAAVVTFRLMMALRAIGVDARMLVAEKLTDSEYVSLAAKPWRLKLSFMAERLRIFRANGFNRKTLFKIDTATDGVPIWNHPWVKEADAVVLGWVNQGLLSLSGIERLQKMGKRLIWIMHDLWNATGICHHPGNCRHYETFDGGCRDCPLLGSRTSANDLSHKTFLRKQKLYDHADISFVAVSSWAKDRCLHSALMNWMDIHVIHNPFPIDDFYYEDAEKEGDKLSIIMGAARLDDPIKGLDILRRALERVKQRGQLDTSNMKLITFGDLRNPVALENLPIEHEHLGRISDVAELRRQYARSHIVLSTSLFETLPGTLIEGMACGCIPVALENGGQGDIISHGETGFLLPFPGKVSNPTAPQPGDYDADAAAERIAQGLEWATEMQSAEMRKKVRESIARKFDPTLIARQILHLSTIAP